MAGREGRGERAWRDFEGLSRLVRGLDLKDGRDGGGRGGGVGVGVQRVSGVSRGGMR